MSTARFSGGTIGNGRWDEEEHPRGSDGRFAVAGGGGTSRVAQARKKLLANIKRKIENGEPTTDYERQLAIKHILPKGERAEFMDNGVKPVGAKISGEIAEHRKRLDALKGSMRLSDIEERLRIRNVVIKKGIQLNRARMADELSGDARRRAISRFEKSYGKGSFKRTLR